MPDLAGFDAVIEFGPAALRTSVLDAMAAAGLAFPLERRNVIPPSPPTHFVFDDVSVALAVATATAADSLIIRLHFINSSILSFVDLSGTIDVAIPISLATGATADARVLRLEQTERQITTNFDPHSHPSSFDTVPGLVAGFVGREVAGLNGGNPIDVPIPIRVDAVHPDPARLVVTALEMRLFGEGIAGAAAQSLALFIAFRGAGGDPSGRTGADLSSNDFALTIGAEPFRDHFLPPAFQQAFRVATRAELPRPTGSADRVVIPADPAAPPRPRGAAAEPEIFIELLEFGLETDGVRVQIRARKPRGGFGGGLDLLVWVTGHIGFSVEAGQLRTDWTVIGVDAANEYPALWLINPLGLVIAAVVEIFTHRTAHVSGASMVPDVPDILLSLPRTLPGLNPAHVEVTPAYFRVVGNAVPRPLRPAALAVDLTVQVVEDAVEPVDQDIYRATGCPEGDYPYVGYARSQRAIFRAAPVFENAPIRMYRWSISTGAGEPQVLTEPGGTARIGVGLTRPGPPADYAFPVEVALAYRIYEEGTKLELKPVGDSGLFSVYAHCLIEDSGRRMATASRRAAFATRFVDLGPDWVRDLARCGEMLNQRVEQARGNVARQATGRPFRLPGEALRPGIAATIRPETLAVLATANDPLARGMLRNLAIQHGADLTLAFAQLSPAALAAAKAASVPVQRAPAAVNPRLGAANTVAIRTATILKAVMAQAAKVWTALRGLSRPK